MKKILLAAFAALAACGNPELALEVELPPSLKPLARAIDLHVYVPPPGGGFDCMDLELGRVDAETRSLSEAQVVRLMGREEAPIRDLDRLARNVLYVEILGEEDRPIAFACAETAEFADDLAISVIAEPAAHLELPQNLDLSRYVAEVLQPRIPVRVLDVLDQPVPGALISWTVASKDGATDDTPETTDASGAGDIDPDLPTRVGPFVLVVRASWLDGGPVEVRGLVAPTPKTGALPGLPLGAEVGRFRPGKASVVVLYGFGVDRRVDIYDASSFRPGDSITPTESIPVGEGAMLAKLDYPDDELDRIVTLATPLNNFVFTRYDPDGTSVEKRTTRPQGANAIRKILNSGSCRLPGRPMLTVVFEGDVVANYDEQGNLLSERRTTREENDYVTSGCLGDETGIPRRVLVKRTPFDTSNLEIISTNMNKVASWLDQPAFLSFAPPIGGPELLLANTVQTSGRGIAQGRLRLDEDDPRIEVLANDAVADVPLLTSGFDADGDDRLDFATVVTNDAATTGVRHYGLRVSIPDEYSGQRISGTISIGDDLCYVIMLTGDFDGDGSDDVLVSEVTPLACGSLGASRVFLFPMGASE